MLWNLCPHAISLGWSIMGGKYTQLSFTTLKECMWGVCWSRTISWWWSNACSPAVNEEEIPWNWFSPWISTWEVLLNSTVEIIHIPHSFWFSIVYFHVQCEKYLDFPLSTEVLTTFRSLDETHISDLRMYSFCQWPKLLSIKMYSRPYMGGTCKGLDASGQLNAVWSHCWSCLNEIRGVPRQAGLSWPDRGGSSISKWPAGKCCSGSPKLFERGTCKPDKSNSGEKPCVSSAITLGAKSVSEAGELLFLQALIKGELELSATKP